MRHKKTSAEQVLAEMRKGASLRVVSRHRCDLVFSNGAAKRKVLTPTVGVLLARGEIRHGESRLDFVLRGGVCA